MKDFPEAWQTNTPLDPIPLLTTEDLSLVRAELLKSEDPIARRADLVLLHDRVSRMDEAMGELLAKAVDGEILARDEAVRLENLEAFVTRLEALLRNELTQTLAAGNLIGDKESGHGLWGDCKRVVKMVSVLAIGILAGSALSDGLRDLESDVQMTGHADVTKLLPISSPNGSGNDSKFRLD